MSYARQTKPINETYDLRPFLDELVRATGVEPPPPASRTRSWRPHLVLATQRIKAQNALIAATDALALDRSDENKLAYRQARQRLRDLMATAIIQGVRLQR